MRQGLQKAMPVFFISLCLVLIPGGIFSEDDGFELVIQNGHSSRVWGISYSRDGSVFVSASHDNTVKVWNRHGYLLRTLGSSTETPGFCFGATVSPDNSTVAAASDGCIRLWTLNGMLIKKINLYGGVYCIAWSPDGEMFASGHMDKMIKLWDRNGSGLGDLRGHTGQIYGVAFSPDSSMIASASQDGTIRIWRRDGTPVRTITGHRGHVNSVSWSPDGKFILSAGQDRTVRIWSASGQQKRIMRGHSAAVRSCAWNRDGTRSASASEDGTIRIWKDNGSPAGVYRGETGPVYSLAWSPDGKTMVSGHGVDDSYGRKRKGINEMRMWNADGICTRIMKGHSSGIYSALFSPDGKAIAAAFSDNTVRIWNIDGSIRAVLEGHADKILAIAMTRDGVLTATGSRDSTIRIWDRSGRKRVIRGHASAVTALGWSSDGKILASASEDMTVRLWDRKGRFISKFNVREDRIDAIAWNKDGTYFLGGVSSKGTVIKIYTHKGVSYGVGKSDPGYNELKLLLDRARGTVHPLKYLKIRLKKNEIRLRNKDKRTVKKLLGHRSHVSSARFSPDGTAVVSTAGNPSIRVWNTATGKSMSLASFSNGEWFMYNDSGYWDSSRLGGQHVAMVRGKDARGVDQFALRNNRPDLVMGNIGLFNLDMVRHFYAQFTRRLRRSGLSERDLASGLHVPEAVIDGVKKDNKFAEVRFTLRDSRYSLKRYNIYVNDVPLFGASGKPLKGSSAALSRRIELVAGENKIEVSCMNEKGAESIRALRMVTYNGKSKGDLYFIGFGVSRYRDSTLNLKYAHQDALDLSGIFKNMQPGYKKIIIKTFIDSQVTVEALKRAKEVLKKAGVDDTVVIFIAGHGVHDDDDEGTYYYLTYDADVHDLAGSAANFELIEDLLQGIAPRKKLFLMDTCESGDIDERIYEIEKDKNSRGLYSRSARKLVIKIKKKRKKNRKNRQYLLERSRYIYNDLVRRSGSVVFSSSRGNELSYEHDRFRNGYFTEEIVNAFKGKADKDRNGIVSMSELRAYVSNAVARLSKNLQHPTVDRDNIYIRFSFPRVK